MTAETVKSSIRDIYPLICVKTVGQPAREAVQ